jgi:hypothetical protein
LKKENRSDRASVFSSPGKCHINNKKYLDVLKEMIQPEYVWKTLKWVNTLDENNKKGMRILKTI